jgi:CheY-like chemotaxis protein
MTIAVTTLPVQDGAQPLPSPLRAGGVGGAYVLSKMTLSEDPIWDRLEAQVRPAALSSARVLLMGFDGANRALLRGWLRGFGVPVAAAAPGIGHFGDTVSICRAFNHVIVNLDSFDSIQAAVEALLTFRKRAPNVTVVAVSSDVSGDDLGRERTAICDATLRAPISQERFRTGLIEAGANRAATA